MNYYFRSDNGATATDGVSSPQYAFHVGGPGGIQQPAAAAQSQPQPHPHPQPQTPQPNFNPHGGQQQYTFSQNGFHAQAPTPDGMDTDSSGGNGGGIASPFGTNVQQQLQPQTQRDSPPGSGTSGLTEEQAESKRKAQNRAAQRAFRERKEQKVRELEQKLSIAEERMNKLANENERLKKENTVISTKNQVLEQQQQQQQNTVSHHGNNHDRIGVPSHQKLLPSFPPEQFYSTLLAEHDQVGQPSTIIYDQPESGERMLGAGALWQYIMEHDNDSIDLEFVVAYLKDKSRCDGFGPVYPISDVNEAIRIATKIGRIPI